MLRDRSPEVKGHQPLPVSDGDSALSLPDSSFWTNVSYLLGPLAWQTDPLLMGHILSINNIQTLILCTKIKCYKSVYKKIIKYCKRSTEPPTVLSSCCCILQEPSGLYKCYWLPGPITGLMYLVYRHC